MLKLLTGVLVYVGITLLLLTLYVIMKFSYRCNKCGSRKKETSIIKEDDNFYYEKTYCKKCNKVLDSKPVDELN